MRIQLIADGKTRFDRLIRRWGVSFLIGEEILFDTFGDAGVFARNCDKFGVNLEGIRHVVVSHDDWDHTAGLWEVIRRAGKPTVYLCSGSSAVLKDRVRQSGARLCEVVGRTRIQGPVWSTGQMRGETAAREIFEQAVLIESEDGVSVLTGCAHPGLPAILRAASVETGQSPRAAVGGFHLKDMDPEAIRRVAEEVLSAGVRKVVPLHCSGARARKEFRSVFGAGYSDLRPGETLEL